MQVEFSFYQGEYGGTLLTQAEFERWQGRAAARVQSDTAGRAETAADEETVLLLKLCVCAVAEALYEAEQTRRSGGVLSAETVGAWSRRYAVPRSAVPQITAAENLYLAATGLLYRGRCRV